MNYLKTKTIQKATVVKRGFSSALLSLLLLTNCGPNQHAGTPASRAHIAEDPNKTYNDVRIKTFMQDGVGIFDRCGKWCLLKEVLEDSRAEKNTRDSSTGQKTFVIPKKKDGVLYFNQIAAQSTLGDEAGRKATEANRKKVKVKGGLELNPGLSIAMKNIFKDFLQTKNAHTAKHPRFFVVAEYLNFSEQCRITFEEVSDKQERIKQLREHLANFEQEVSKVRPGANGIEIVMPTDSTEGPSDGGFIFQEPKKGSLKERIAAKARMKSAKHYTLDKDLQTKVNGAIDNVKKAIDTLEKELK
jgi:hypothetical protein